MNLHISKDAWPRIIIIFLFCLCSYGNVFAREGDISQEAGNEAVSIYSNMCWNLEAGELVGERVIIISFGANYFVGDYFVFFQGPEGDNMPPYLTDATIKNGKINFSYPASNDPHEKRLITFEGKISPDQITGDLSFGPKESYEQKTLHLIKQPNKKIPASICK